jgi:hypothetical protein
MHAPVILMGAHSNLFLFVALHFLLINGGHYFQNHLRATFFRMSDVFQSAQGQSRPISFSPCP